MLRKLEVLIRYLFYSLSNINSPHLGDIVWYNKEKCMLIQGVQNPFWDLLPMTKENLEKDKRIIYKFIHRDKFKLQNLFFRFAFSFNSSFKFLKSNWFSIDIRNQLGSRICYCD